MRGSITSGVMLFLLSLPATPVECAQSIAEALRPGAGSTSPMVERSVQPKYTSDALRARIEGVVLLEAVVKADGSVGEVRIMRSLDKTFGLDGEAVVAAMQWRFKPATRDGKPVAMVVMLELAFRLPQSDGTTSPSVRSAMTTNPVGGPADEFTRGAYAASTPGLVLPKTKSAVQPTYPDAAMKARIQGVVSIDVVVLPDGTVGRARLARPQETNQELGEAALDAAKRWTFTPGTLNGTAVPVLIVLEMTFRVG